MAFAASGLYDRFRPMLPELLKFGVVGGVGSVIDLGGAALLHRHHVDPLAAKAISTAVATVVTYLGSRYWTFRHRENQALGREAVLFIVLNVIGLLIAEAVIAVVTYGLGLRNGLEYNAASVIGTGLATIFRYFAYRTWVFTAPADAALAAATAPELVSFPHYAPWELDPAFLAAEQPVAAHAAERPAWMEQQITLPNERVAEPLLASTQSAAGPDHGPATEPLTAQPLQGRHRRP